ncbi:hypothetical protein GIB67_028615 [Kingdonia uniflora]|uniref:Uncharacterized protein n=1 Tax=Kingdonia uniflora TaxID=39325 RepID=A0A7J7KZH9_9MAGN|nr:hypothetical protein GIB67_028615 [Kingdonia uniflora]
MHDLVKDKGNTPYMSNDKKNNNTGITITTENQCSQNLITNTSMPICTTLTNTG